MAKQQRAVSYAIGAEMRRIRESRGWSQPRLAEVLGLSPNYVALLERAERIPSVEVLVRIATRLGTTISALVGEPADEGDPWISEGIALLHAVPESARAATIAMLRGVASMTPAPTPAPASAPARPTRARPKRAR